MRKNEIFKSRKIVLLIAVAIINVLFCGAVFAQCPCAVSVPAEEWLPAGFYPAGSPEAAKLVYQHRVSSSKSIFRASNTPAEVNMGSAGPSLWTRLDYNGNSLFYYPQVFYSGDVIINPYQVSINITVNSPVNVVYSLYTYKSTFPQDGKRVRPGIDSPSMQAIQECGTVTPLSTQTDIDKYLNKIYEFAPIKETESGWRDLDWDGKTSNGVVVRDCVFVAVHDKDTNNLLGLVGGRAVEGYTILASPGVEFTAGPTSNSAKITVAYDKPVGRIWAILATANCTTGSEYVTFEVVNQGGPAIAAGMNKKSPGSALAVTELKNPTLDMDGLVKIFNWNDITGLDGKPVLPPDQSTQYMVILVLEGAQTDKDGNIIMKDGLPLPIPTVTGLNDGYLYVKDAVKPFPMPWSYTGIQNPVSDNKIVVETMQDGFIINPKDNYDGEWALTSVAGVKLTTGKGSFVSKSGLPKGVYLLTVSNPQGVKETHKVIVR